ncbi:MAG: DUF1131 family protein [Pseudomonadota bacterium]
MRSWFQAGLAGIALVLTGCATSIEDSVESIPTRTFFTIMPDAVGALTPETAYSARAIQETLPGYTAETITSAVEARTVSAFGVFTEGIQVLQVHRGRNGKIGPIHGVTHHLSGPNGERIGSTFGALRIDRNDCRVGRNLWRGMALCSARGTENITLVFAIPQYQGPFDRLAPDDELRNAVLQRIVWQP